MESGKQQFLMINLFVAMLIGFHSRMIAHMAVSGFYISMEKKIK